MFQELLAKIARELNKARIPYMIIGGQAVLIHGEPRLTKDIDITLGIGPDKLPAVLALTAVLKMKILTESAEEFVQKTLVLPALDEETGIRIDFVFSYSPYEQLAIERARDVTMKTTPPTAVRFASLEDIVIHKIIAGRPRDIEDVKSILLKNSAYDRRYITGWLKEFDESLGEGFVDAFLRVEKELQ